MRDIRDSPAWHSLGPFTRTYRNLTFSFYIDWFNPLTNKIAGKKVSCDAIMMFCLNLPPELRHLPENTFFVGLTPPPHEPSITTITALLDPVVGQLDELYAGKIFISHRYPQGFFRRIAVLPLMGDLLGIQKVAGFASHSHKLHFCWFCHCTRDKLYMWRLDIKNWVSRTGIEVRVSAEQWRSATTKVARKAIFDSTGVRWSSLDRLIYRDPVQHTVLGIMHNWLEGVLQHYAQEFWGLGIEPSAVGTNSMDDSLDGNADSSPGATHQLSAVDIDLFLEESDDDEALQDEILDLASDSQSHADVPSHPRALRRHATSSLANLAGIADADAPDDFAQDPDWIMADDESSSSDNDDDKDNFASGPCIFDADAMKFIRSCITSISLPTYTQRII
jgi:hypothetical protein